jgi:CRP/FNR family transcriptional regulator, cyclic AMP receptor protein
MKETGPKKIELLRRVPVLSELSEEALKSLLNEATEQAFAPNQVIIKDGSYLADLYIILSGRVEVKKKGSSIAKLGKGQFVGEMAFVNDGPTGRSADIVALEETHCLTIKGATWYAFLRRNPDVAIEVIRTLADRLRNIDWNFSELQNLPAKA